jgi:hypothetical protein
MAQYPATAEHRLRHFLRYGTPPSSVDYTSKGLSVSCAIADPCEHPSARRSWNKPDQESKASSARPGGARGVRIDSKWRATGSFQSRQPRRCWHSGGRGINRLRAPRMFRMSRPHGGVLDVPSVDQIESTIRSGQPSRYHIDEISAAPLASGQTSRRRALRVEQSAELI